MSSSRDSDFAFLTPSDQPLINKKSEGYSSQLVPDKDSEEFYVTPILSSLALDSSRLFGHEFVSHTTSAGPHIWELITGGIKTESHPKNLYGGKAFYMLRGVHSAVSGDTMIIYDLDRSRLKAVDHPSSEMDAILPNLEEKYISRAQSTRYAKKAGYNAIRYEVDTHFDTYAILNNPNELLKPSGVYPVVEVADESGHLHEISSVSPRTIKGMRALGLIGTAYSIYSSVQEIRASDNPLQETIHQGILTTTAIVAGAKAGVASMPMCAAVAGVFPPLSWVTVPTCITTASMVGGTAATLAAEYVWRIPRGNFKGLIFPSAEAATTSPEQLFPFEFSNTDWIQARNLFMNPSLLEKAGSHVISAALFMKHEPNDLFDLGDTAQNIGEFSLHQALYGSFSDPKERSETLPRLIGSGFLGEPSDIASYYIPASLDGLFASYPDAEKQKAIGFVDEIRKALEADQPIPEESFNKLKTLMQQDLGVNQLLDVIGSYNPSKLDITGFERESTVTKPYNELKELIAQGAPAHKIITKTKEVQDNILLIKLDRQEFSKKLNQVGHIAQDLSEIARLTKNKAIGKIAVCLSSAVKVGISITELVAGASILTGIGAFSAIAVGIFSVISAFSDDNDSDGMSKAFQQLADGINKVIEGINDVRNMLQQLSQQEMDFYYSLKHMLETISDQIAIMQDVNKRDMNIVLGYLQTILQFMKDESNKTTKIARLNTFKALAEEIARKKTTLRLNPSHYEPLRDMLITSLTNDNSGIRDGIFTGLDGQGRDIDDGFSPEFHLGELQNLYNEFNFESKNYSPPMVSNYLENVLTGKTKFQLAPCLTISDLAKAMHEGQKTPPGLSSVIKSFFAIEDAENPAEILVIPIILQEQWQLVVINKTAKQVEIFSPSGQNEYLTERVSEIIKKNIPGDFILQQKPFNENISPSYYGAIIVEVVKKISSGGSYNEILKENSNEKLESISKAHTDLFKPSEKLLVSRKLRQEDVINPVIAGWLIFELLAMYSTVYPNALKKELVKGLTIDALEIASIRDTLTVLEYPSRLHQYLSNENLFKTLFKRYQDAIHAVKVELIKARNEYEELHGRELNNAAKRELVSQYADEKMLDQFRHQEIPVKVYGYWFQPVAVNKVEMDIWPENTDIETYGEMVIARDAFINEQKNQISQFKASFVASEKNKIHEFQFSNKLGLYHFNYPYDVYSIRIAPSLIMPEHKEDPILPNLFSHVSYIPDMLLQAQALGYGNIELRYEFNDVSFIIKIYFVTNDGVKSCAGAFSLAHGGSVNFYDRPEAIWWNWVGGTYPIRKKILLSGKLDSHDGNLETYDDRFVQVLKTSRRFRTGYLSFGSGDKAKILGIGYGRSGSMGSMEDIGSERSKALTKIGGMVQKKYTEMRRELNKELIISINDKGTSLGRAALELKKTYGDLRKTLEFVFPSYTGSNSIVHSFLFNGTAIDNIDKMIAYLNGPSEQYIATQFISDMALNASQAIILSKLLSQSQKYHTYVDDLEEKVLGTYDDFIPYKAMEKPSQDKIDKFQKRKLDFIILFSKIFEKLTYELASVNINQQQHDQVILNLSQFSKYKLEFFNEVDAKEKDFLSGDITFEEAVTVFRTKQGQLGLPSNDLLVEPLPHKIHKAKVVVEEDYGVIEAEDDYSESSEEFQEAAYSAIREKIFPTPTSGAASNFNFPLLNWIPPLFAVAGSVLHTARSWLTFTPVASSAEDFASMHNPHMQEDEKSDFVHASESETITPQQYHYYFDSELMLFMVAIHNICKLLPSNQDHILTRDEAKTLSDMQKLIQELQEKIDLLAKTPAVKKGFLDDKFAYIMRQIDLNNENSLFGQIDDLMAQDPENRIITGSQFCDFERSLERIQEYLRQIEDLNEQFAQAEIDAEVYQSDHPDEKIVATYKYDFINNHLKVILATVSEASALHVDSVKPLSQRDFCQFSLWQNPFKQVAELGIDNPRQSVCALAL